mmetsp:Transcript_9213/g.33776  ORF Transcript_9213/g.33776 Transcript_9213/m.33776 type:complete len:300 (-) Transcript_9213:84-983(-)
MRQETHNTDLLVHAVGTDHLRRYQLEDRLRFPELVSHRREVVFNTTRCSSSFVGLRTSLVGSEHLQSRVALHAELAAQTLTISGRTVHRSKLRLARQALSSILVLRSEPLAMTTPRGEELHHPQVLALCDEAVEVALVQGDDLAATTATGARGALAASARTLARQAILHHGLGVVRERLDGCVGDRLRLACPLVVGRFCVGLEYLNGREALDAVLRAQALVLIAVYRGDANTGALQCLRGLLPLRRQLLAVAAPRREEFHKVGLLPFRHLAVEVPGAERLHCRRCAIEGCARGRQQGHQ